MTASGRIRRIRPTKYAIHDPSLAYPCSHTLFTEVVRTGRGAEVPRPVPITAPAAEIEVEVEVEVDGPAGHDSGNACMDFGEEGEEGAAEFLLTMASTRQSAVQGITTPSKPENQGLKPPKTPSTLYKDDFELTPGTNITGHSFDSGFFSSASGDSYRHVDGYKDWVLFPEDPDTRVYDTSRFFADADASTQADYDEFAAEDTANNYPQATFLSPTSSHSQTTSSPHDPIHDTAKAAINETLFHTVRLALHNCRINPPPSLHVHKSPNLADLDQEFTSPLEIWEGSVERHESIAYKFEHPPYPAREHLRQQCRTIQRRTARKHNRRQQRD
ncbi:hypothetical protein EG329_011679 [Mollisiaceae sp. DMI_Dod_QoI]|nr:hypothetical protein EG329_011679 [Helotiales sp. DMI_Dod_QoI]